MTNYAIKHLAHWADAIDSTTTLMGILTIALVVATVVAGVEYVREATRNGKKES